MPNRPTHIAAGVPAGFAYSLYKSNGHSTLARVAEGGGGLLGGFLGAITPDLIDPPVSPCHRSVGHGLAIGATAWARSLDSWQTALRAQADHYRIQAMQSTEPMLSLWYSFLETGLRVLAGILAGFLAGYVSHVALDCFTPGCLPLVS